MASITSAELIAYGSSNLPESDTTTSGGAISLTTIVPEFIQSAATIPQIKSTAAGDTTGKTVRIYGRLASGALTDEGPITLNGTTAVAFTTSFERILKVIIAGSPTGIVTVYLNDASTKIVDIPVGITSAHRMFYDSASEAGATDRYEKMFWKNTNGTNTLNDATVTLTADPSVGGGNDVLISLEDTPTDSVSNRTEVPANTSFVNDGSALVITGGLAAGAAQGIWVKRSLGAGAGPLDTSFTTKLAGTTT